MAKVRVPRERRPPTRFGKITKVASQITEHQAFRVVGEYRSPREGEYFWNVFFGHVSRAAFDYDQCHRVILEPVQ
jgi:hypothetical protein